MHPDRYPAEGNDLTQWLVEAGRRAREHDKAVLESSRIAVAQRKTSKPGWTRSAMMGLAALAFLQYYYFHVMVEIGKLPTVIVFLPPPLG
ncbi:MAG TPA: hypothetical protein VG873_08920 [Burkholderiales bacterium]|nr:hypothetical protein [Burkholderiales bacterium]